MGPTAVRKASMDRSFHSFSRGVFRPVQRRSETTGAEPLVLESLVKKKVLFGSRVLIWATVVLRHVSTMVICLFCRLFDFYYAKLI